MRNKGGVVLFFTLEKMERRVQELAQRRYFDMQTIAPLEAMEGKNGYDEVYTGVPENFDGKPFSLGDRFCGKDKFLWIRKTVQIPPSRPGCEVTGLFDFGKTGGGLNSGFESMLYIDGHPYQAVDTYHHDVLLEKLAGRRVTMMLLLWTGRGGQEYETVFEHRFTRADLGYLHKDTDELYYLCRAALETAQILPEDDSERDVLLDAMERCMLFLNWDEDKFYDSVGQALAYLKKILAENKKESSVTIHCVGQTHIDVAWLWRYKNTREKVQRSCATALQLMDEFDQFIFLLTQPQVYKYLKEDCPELYERVKEKVKAGQWEPEGGMWLEADCNISSGESLTRQFLHGIRFFQQEFGKTCEYLWLPDVFGYSWALPQILKQCGIKTFMTTKISWNQFNTMPNDVFFWRGIDGSEVLSYFMEVPPEDRPITDRFSTYNGMMAPRTALGSWKKFRNRDISKDVLIGYGYGDGGGGATRDMVKLELAMQKIPGLPNILPDTAGNFFRKLHQSVEKTDHYIQTWDGELYLEYHRGTYTTQAKNKRWNRKMEYKLAETEWLASVGSFSGGTYPQALLHKAWETVLRNQFHDVIPGSSIQEVYEDSRKQYSQANDALDAGRQEIFRTMAQPIGTEYTVFHFGSFARKDAVVLPVTADGTFYAADGAVLDSQKTADGMFVSVPMGAASMAAVQFVPGESFRSPSSFSYSEADRRLETPHYVLCWNESGRMCSIWDKDNAREVLCGEGNRLEIFEDKPMNYDAWDIDIYYTQKMETASLTAAPQVVEDGALRMVLRFAFAYNLSTFTQDVIVYRDSRRIDFVTKADWHESHRLLKAAFAVDVRSTHATYDIQYGHVERPTHWNTSWDWARFEVVGHKWADLSESNYGVSLLNDCKYGYSIKDNVMKLSLLRSPKRPDPTADMGMHTFTYALLPHAGNVIQGDTIEESVSLNLPLQYFEGRTDGCGKAMVRLSSPALYLDAVKQAEDGDGFVVRVHECRGGTHSAELTSDYGIKRFAACNLLEEVEGELQESSAISFSIKPFEIRSWRVWF